MIPRPPIPEPLWDTVPPEARIALLAVLDAVNRRVLELEQRARDLEARLKLNSTNSSKPPSSDPIGFKRKPPTPPSGRKRGGQPGHRRAQRRLVSPEKVRTTTDCRPTDCRRCGHAPVGDEPAPLVHQADADGGGQLSPAEARCAGRSQRVLRGSLARREGPVAGAGKLQTDRPCILLNLTYTTS